MQDAYLSANLIPANHFESRRTPHPPTVGSPHSVGALGIDTAGFPNTWLVTCYRICVNIWATKHLKDLDQLHSLCAKLISP